MKPIGYARSREYCVRFGWGTLVGLFGAVFAFVYIIIVHGLEHLLWLGKWRSPSRCSLSIPKPL